MVGTAVADPLLGSMLGKDYRVLERIGVGGMAMVYLVEHQSLLKHFAAKVLSAEHASSAEARARFTQEAHAASQLDHENIVSITDFGITADQRPYFVMELLRGMTLADRLDSGPMPLEECVAICVPVARALSHAHAEGIIHRDVKPENVFLVQRTQGRWGVKVLDFGIAKVPVMDRMTKTGQALGSPLFMAPEACRGDDVDQRADVYSFGILLYLMFAGRVPFNDENLLKVLRMQVSAPLPLPSSYNPDLPQPIEMVIVRALAKEPEDRYPTIDALLSDFEAALPDGADILLIQAQFGVSQTPFPGSIERVRNSQRILAATGQHHVVTGPFHAVTGRHQITTTGSHQGVTTTGSHSVGSHSAEPRTEPVLPPAPRRRGSAVAFGVIALLVLGGGGAFAWMKYGRGSDEPTIAAAAATPTLPEPTKTTPEPMAMPAEPTPTEPTPTPTEPTPTKPPETTAETAPPDAMPSKDTATKKKATPSKPTAVKRVAVATTKPTTKPPPSTAGSAASTAGSGSSTLPAPAIVVAPPPTETKPPPPVEPPPPKTEPVVPVTPPPVVTPKKVVGSLDATPSIARLDVDGSLPSTVVRRGIDRVLPSLRDCYRAAAKAQQSTPVASVSLSFEIDETSAARNVSARGAAFGTLSTCARGVLGRVQTPQAPDVGTVRVTVSIKFEPI